MLPSAPEGEQDEPRTDGRVQIAPNMSMNDYTKLEDRRERARTLPEDFVGTNLPRVLRGQGLPPTS